MDGNHITWDTNHSLDVVLGRLWGSDKDNDITTSRSTEKIGPLIYKDKFLIMQIGFHTVPFDVEVLHSKTDYQKHQNREDYGLDYLTYKSIALLKIKLWIHALSFPHRTHSAGLYLRVILFIRNVPEEG